MALFGWLPRRKWDVDVNDLAQAIADQCRDEVQRRIARRAETLTTLAEARGYVRTCAAPIVESAARKMATGQRLRRAHLMRQLIDRAVFLAVSEFASSLLVPRPVLGRQRLAA